MGNNNQSETQNRDKDTFDITKFNQKEMKEDEIYGTIIIIEEKIYQKEFFLKQEIVNDEEKVLKYKKYLEKIKQKPNKNIIQLLQHNILDDGQICASNYKICTVWHYLQRNLNSEINSKILMNLKIQENQIFKLIKDVISGMSYQQSNGVSHKSLSSDNILIDLMNNFKLVDQFIFQQPSNLETIEEKNSQSSNHNIYLSPELMDAYKHRDYAPVLNYYKSDVFIFGIILLETIELKTQQQLFNYDHFTIDYQMIGQKLDSIKNSYNEILFQILEKMLQKQPDGRPDWTELQNEYEDLKIKFKADQSYTVSNNS